jgi:hypothetical protein
LFARDDNRHSNSRTDIKQLRAADAAIGFSAYLNATITVVTSTLTTVGPWSAQDGPVSYDSSDGAFDFVTGIFTTKTAGKYLADAMVCWVGTATGERVLTLATNETVTADVIDYIAGAVSPAIQCNHVHQIMDLPEATLVWVEVLQDQGGPVDITLGSRFSMERIST